MPVPPKQYAVGRGVLKPVELTKPLYCEPVGDIDPIMNGPLGGGRFTAENRPPTGSKSERNLTHSEAEKALSIHRRRSEGCS